MAIDYILPHLPVALPTTPIPQAPDDQAPLIDIQQWQKNLTSCQEFHFHQDAVWRDLFSLTGTTRTFYSASTISDVWTKLTPRLQAQEFKLSSSHHLSPTKTWIDVPFTFRITGPPAARCSGTLSFVPDKEVGWKIWKMNTMLDDLVAAPSVDASPPPPISETKNADGSFEVDCVVLGAGQAGLAVGGRLQALGVRYFILEKDSTVGDNWRRRYDSAKLHTLREYAHLPFERTFGKARVGDKEWLEKDVLAEGFEGWAERFGVNVWTSCEDIRGRFNPEDKKWRLKFSKEGKVVDVVCRFFVFAAGFGGQIPKEPKLDGREEFKGEVMHSEQYKNAKGWAGKHGVVVGSGNTAHDVAEDMLDAGCASVTMIQRNPTVLVNTQHYKMLVEKIYNEETPTEVSDRIQFAGPFAAGRLIAGGGLNTLRKNLTPDYVSGAERAGFRVDEKEDIFSALYVRAGGHYNDVGAIARISAGEFKVNSSPPTGFSADGLVLTNGEVLKADVVVLATGFELDMKKTVGDMFGSEVADQLETVWGLDEERELRGAYKPSGHEAFWYCGGALGQTRFFSRFIGMQIKAKLQGTPLPLYNERQPPINYI